jgi:hypothetical protein
MDDFEENLLGGLALKRAAKDLVWLFLCFFTASYQVGRGSTVICVWSVPSLKTHIGDI